MLTCLLDVRFNLLVMLLKEFPQCSALQNHNVLEYLIVAIIACILICLLLAAMVFVFVNRAAIIVKRSQYELLELMIGGGIIICLASILYAGKPSHALCASRPVLTSVGFTTIFGALFVKSLRVYRVFMRTAMKRVTVSLKMMLKIFAVLAVVDVFILGSWFIVDFPYPTVESVESTAFRGVVERISCKSSSFIFTALLMFWKTIVLIMGLYLTFLIRNLSSDFQESIWIFASSLVVLTGSILIMPLAYLVEMPASTFFLFLALSLLFCTAMIMSFMLLPKVFRLNAQPARSSDYSSTSGQSRKSVVKASSTNNVEQDSEDTRGAESRRNSQREIRKSVTGQSVSTEGT